MSGGGRVFVPIYVCMYVCMYVCEGFHSRMIRYHCSSGLSILMATCVWQNGKWQQLLNTEWLTQKCILLLEKLDFNLQLGTQIVCTTLHVQSLLVLYIMGPAQLFCFFEFNPVVSQGLCNCGPFIIKVQGAGAFFGGQICSNIPKGGSEFY